MDDSTQNESSCSNFGVKVIIQDESSFRADAIISQYTCRAEVIMGRGESSCEAAFINVITIPVSLEKVRCG